MFESCDWNRWRLHAFVIMRNHFRLAWQHPEPNLSHRMRCGTSSQATPGRKLRITFT